MKGRALPHTRTGDLLLRKFVASKVLPFGGFGKSLKGFEDERSPLSLALAMLSLSLHPLGVHMAKTVAQLAALIEHLQQKLESVKASEVAGVVARIREAISYYELTPEQLFGSGPANGKRAAAKPSSTRTAAANASSKKSARTKVAGVKLPPKFADAAGNSWTGRGSTPRWLAEAIAAGKTKEEFAVKA
jgi:DNA-binding protein H-NS